MSRINDMSVSSRFLDLQDIEKNGGATFKLQDKSVTENGVVIADPTYDGLSKVDVGVQGADLENNKTATIDVSTYTEPVQITPTKGKDGMVKATVTLTNIPELTTVPPSWFSTTSSEELNSVVPSGVKCAIFDGTNSTIITGNGESSISVLIASEGTLSFSHYIATYGDSAVIAITIE